MACVQTKFYNCQVFLWWNLFSSFVDSLKIVLGGICFKWIGSFLLYKNDVVGINFLAQMNYIADFFLNKAI